jgi:hypothetical protein
VNRDPWQMTPEERQAEIDALQRDNRAILATPLLSDGNISPWQVGQMSTRQREQYQRNAGEKMRIETRIRQLSRSDADLMAEHAQRTAKENASRLASLENRIEYLTRLERSTKRGQRSRRLKGRNNGTNTTQSSGGTVS